MNKPDYETIANDLAMARLVLQDRGAWTKFNEGESRNHDAAEPDDNDACRFCIVGALKRVTLTDCTLFDRDPNWPRFAAAVDHLTNVLGHTFVSTFNDDRHTKHRDVLALLDTGIAEAELAA